MRYTIKLWATLEQDFNNVDVKGALLLYCKLSRYVGISQDLLQAKGAINAQYAITSYQDLRKLISTGKIARKMIDSYISALTEFRNEIQHREPNSQLNVDTVHYTPAEFIKKIDEILIILIRYKAWEAGSLDLSDDESISCCINYKLLPNPHAWLNKAFANFKKEKQQQAVRYATTATNVFTLFHSPIEPLMFIKKLNGPLTVFDSVTLQKLENQCIQCCRNLNKDYFYLTSILVSKTASQLVREATYLVKRNYINVALFLTQLALNIFLNEAKNSQLLKQEREIIECYSLIGSCYFYLNQIDDAIFNCNKALEQAKTLLSSEHAKTKMLQIKLSQYEASKGSRPAPAPTILMLKLIY